MSLGTGCVGRIERSLTHHSQFSRLGIQRPTLVYSVFDVGREWVNEGGSFYSSLISVWLVCYAHVFHVKCTLGLPCTH